MDKQHARSLWKRLQQELGEKLLSSPLKRYGWTFQFDAARRRIGHADPQTKIISMSARLLQNGLSAERAEDTIRHEIAHAIDFEQRNRSNHDSRWKRLARLCGAEPERTGDIPDEVKPDARWVRSCPACERVVGRYYSKPKSDKFICAHCEGDVDVEKGPAHPDYEEQAPA